MGLVISACAPIGSSAEREFAAREADLERLVGGMLDLTPHHPPIYRIFAWSSEGRVISSESWLSFIDAMADLGESPFEYRSYHIVQEFGIAQSITTYSRTEF